MNSQIWMFFALITNSVIGVCQLSEDFSSESAFQDEILLGDIEDFKISQGLLSLDAPEGGTSILYAPITWLDTMEYSLWVNLDFAPSQQNRLTYYLWSDSIENLEDSDAIFLQIGESGTVDNLKLYQRIDGGETLLGEGEMSRLGQAPAFVRIRVLWSQDLVQVDADYQGGSQYQTEMEVIVNKPQIETAWTAIQCEYTNTRSDKFFFDDLYVGPIRRDTVAPYLTEVATEVDRLTLTYSEQIDQEALDIDNFIIIPTVEVSSIEPINDRTVVIELRESLLPGISYSLAISEVRDLAGNSVDTLITIEIVDSPSIGDILINEILFNPEGDGADFVELINTTDQKLSLEGVSLSNLDRGESVDISSVSVILPHQKVVITDDRLNIIDSYASHEANVIFEQNIPRYNNDDGNVSISYLGELLDSFDYDEDYHDILLDDVDGVSLERRENDSPTNNVETWTSALASSGYATPGKENSVLLSKAATEGSIDIQLITKHFSPNGDGVGDELLIDYDIDGIYYATVKIFNDNGVMVQELMTNVRITGSGEWSWDGRTENGDTAAIGIYVIWAELYNVEGDRQIKKLTGVLADYLD